MLDSIYDSTSFFFELDEWGRYTGKPVYMYHRIDMKGADDETTMS